MRSISKLWTEGVPFSPLLGSPTSPDHNLGYAYSRQSGLPRRPHTLISLWLWISPCVVLVLSGMLIFRKKPVTSDLMNPYICGPAAQDTSLQQLCATTSPDQDWRTKLKGYEAGLDRHLTQRQCDAVYPGLYQEVDRAIEYWRNKGGVTTFDLDAAEVKGQARAAIINNRLYVKSYSESQQGTRTKATLAGINEALVTSLEPLPDVEFVVMTGDNGVPQGAPWALGRRDDQFSLTLMPDYGFWSWPEPRVGTFLEVQDKTKQYEAKLRWQDKTAKLFGRFQFMTDIRKDLWELARKHSWGAIGELDWRDPQMKKEALMTPEEHCQFKYLAHVEGWAYSGRLKYLQQCRSVVVAHNMQYVQHFHHLFNPDWESPEQNIVISPGHAFDELPATMDRLLRNDTHAEQIANKSYEFWRHWLSPASVDCYWRRLIKRWAEVQNFDPVLNKTDVPYNSFILMGRVDWEAY